MKKILFSMLLLAGYSASAFAQCDLEVKEYIKLNPKQTTVDGKTVVEFSKDIFYSVPGYLFIMGNTEFSSNDELKQHVLDEVEGVELCLEWQLARTKPFTCMKLSLDKVLDAYNTLMKDDKIISVRNVFCKKDVSKENIDLTDSSVFKENNICLSSLLTLSFFNDYNPTVQDRHLHAAQLDSLISRFDLVEECPASFEYEYYCPKDANVIDVARQIAETGWFNRCPLVSSGPNSAVVEFFSPTSVKSTAASSSVKVTYYDLQGRPVQSPAHSGIIIGDGRKMIVE